jgi:phosphatidylethanolamine/phosphatidyl-N-methylethanolamine N-methyltransferase
VQHLGFANDSFDAAVATFVFCSVPDPVKGLSELRRVVKPGGTVYLLEHMRSPHETVGKIMDFLNPVTACLMGVHINRQTIENVEASGLKITSAHGIWAGGIYKRLTARVP